MMETNQIERVIDYAEIDSILQEKTKVPLVILLCPNYEDRSQAIVNKISTLSESITCPISYSIVCFKNTKNNDLILEDLIESNINKVLSVINFSYDDICWLNYPDDFFFFFLADVINRYIDNSSVDDTPGDFLFDISTMPRSIIFHLCEHIQRIVKDNGIGKVYFAYAEPKTYSMVHYAQDIGLLKGMFCGGPLKLDPNREIHASIFPGRTGHEGKLFCDILDNYNRSISYTIYFPIHINEFNSSLDIMRANQTLLDRDAYNLVFYCSLQDVIKEVDDCFRNESIHIKKINMMDESGGRSHRKHTFLVANFGAKIFVPVAYFELKRIKEIDPDNIEIDICHMKGFQYTSLYSIGIGEMTCIELKKGSKQ